MGDHSRRWITANARLPHLVPLLLLLACLAGCRGGAPGYSPHESILSIAAEFELLTPPDAYREAPGRDLTGQSAARVTLVRLSNYQELHPGELTPEILMLRGRALEWLSDLTGAFETYRLVMEQDTPLRDEAARRATLLEDMLAVSQLADGGGDLLDVLAAFDEQASAFRELADATDDRFYSSLARREAENGDVRRAELMAANRYMLANGEEEALRALESLVQNHRESRRATEHALALARFHCLLAEEEVRLHPPEQAGFSSERFRRHYDAAADLLHRVSQADGKPERLTARHELDALLAFGESVSQRAQ